MAYKIGKKARKAALLLVVNLFFILLCFLVLIPVLYAFSVSLTTVCLAPIFLFFQSI